MRDSHEVNIKKVNESSLIGKAGRAKMIGPNVMSPHEADAKCRGAASEQITKQQSKRDVLHEALRRSPNISRGIYP